MLISLRMVNYTMILVNELRVCKSCGNVFSKKAGISNITSCPQCNETNFDYVECQESELEQE